MKVKNILPPETIADAIRQTLIITKALAFDKNLSIRINLYHNLAEVPQITHVQHYLLTDPQLQLQKTLNDNGKQKIEIDEVTKINTLDDFVNTESNIDDTKVISVNQKSFSKTFYCPDSNKEVTPDDEV